MVVEPRRVLHGPDPGGGGTASGTMASDSTSSTVDAVRAVAIDEASGYLAAPIVVSVGR